jgi:hypothetical protein
MSDYSPARARGERLDGGQPAPPAPDRDEQWDYIADHLRAIRASVAFIAAVAVLAVAFWLLVLFGVITVEAKTTTDVFGMAAGLA